MEETKQQASSIDNHDARDGVTEAIRVVEAAGYRVIQQSKFQPAHTRDTIAFVLKRREEGKSDQAVANELGVSRSTVSGIIWRHKTSKERPALQKEDSSHVG